MRQAVWWILLSGLLSFGCGSEECQKCKTDSDCSGGLLCVTFGDQSMRCGSGTGTTTCRVLH